MKHTPTPWKLGEATERGPKVYVGSSMGFVANCISSTGHDYSQDEINAAHIVKCVNAHDELVTIIKTVEQGLRTSGRPTAETLWAVTNLQSAIAKAEGRS